jgi:hypothetical protein
MTCVHCERLSLAAFRASRAYYRLQADLECEFITHGREPLLVGQDVEKAEQDRSLAIAELTAHKNTHKGKQPVVELLLSKGHSA